jgi:hypothetical protein
VKVLRLGALFVAVTISANAFAQEVPRTGARAAADRGWDAIRDGRNEAAADAFADAIEARPGDPALYPGCGPCGAVAWR